MAEQTEKDDKTEEPTERKLRQAREKGDVAKSQEIPGWFVLATGLAVLITIGPTIGGSLAASLTVFFEHPHDLSLDPAAALDLVAATAWRVALVTALAFLAFFIAGTLGHIAQHGLLFAPSKLEPKLSKLNPIEGAKRMFGPQGWMNFAKGVGKMALVGGAIAIALWPRMSQLEALPAMAPAAMMTFIRDAAIQLLIAALIVYAVIAFADLIFQRQQHHERNKMSRKELKDEFKDTEGDPAVRAKLRQIRQERAQRRMMAEVPDASVVVTNPTHYSVALKYEQGVTAAPICVAKGVDETALRIREIAKAHDVPIVEDPPLARALHASADLDEPIPVEHYQAVAKVIGYVMSLSKGKASRGRAR